MDAEVAVIGAGPGGLGTAAELIRRGLQPVVLERGTGPGPKWRHSYDSLRINTSAAFSHLPGMRLSGAGQWPTRDELVDYYECYAERFGISIRAGCEVTRIDRDSHGWSVEATSERLRCRAVVVATAKDHTPVVPDWPGRSSFAGRLLHSAEYRNAEPFAGERVIVVGAGNSGFDIAVDLLRGGAQSVHLSIRTAPHIIHRAVGPLPSDVLAIAGRHLPSRFVDRAAHALRTATGGYVLEHRLGRPPEGLMTHLRRTGMIPTIDPGHFVDLVRTGALPVVAGVDELAGQHVVLSDETRLPIDALIAATGYRTGLEPLVGHLGVLDELAYPTVHGERTHPDAPGLHFIGFSHPLSGNLRELRLVSRRIARAVAGNLPRH